MIPSFRMRGHRAHFFLPTFSPQPHWKVREGSGFHSIRDVRTPPHVAASSRPGRTPAPSPVAPDPQAVLPASGACSPEPQPQGPQCQGSGHVLQHCAHQLAGPSKTFPPDGGKDHMFCPDTPRIIAWCGRAFPHLMHRSFNNLNIWLKSEISFPC